MIKLKNVSIGYRQRHQRRYLLSRELNFTASNGELVAVVGPNGVGKSTLLRTIARQHYALGGSIFIDGKEWSRYSHKEFARKCSFVSTGQIPVRQLTVYEVVAMARYPYTGWGGRLSSGDNGFILKSLEGVGLLSLKDRLLGEISDGERQRTVIARAMAQDTQLVILDEPTAFLDIPNRFEVLQLMRTISREQDKLFLFSSHDLEFILEIVDKIWLLYPDNATEGTPEELLRDASFDPLFKNTGIHYDIHKGLYIPPRLCNTVVSLEGPRDETVWAEKALLRIGYTVKLSPETPQAIYIHAARGFYTIKIKNMP